jgi:hypothetical protein
VPGNVSRSVEKQLLASGELLESQVLKLARHGSKSSSSREFLARVAPRVAIDTPGFGGFRNLPNPETLEALRNTGARIVRNGPWPVSTRTESRKGGVGPATARLYAGRCRRQGTTMKFLLLTNRGRGVTKLTIM